jgi:hypothetical protein
MSVQKLRASKCFPLFHRLRTSSAGVLFGIFEAWDDFLSITAHYVILPRARCVKVVARNGLQRVDIIDHADIIDADLMITDVMHVLSILGSCAEIAFRHLGVELRMHLTAIGSDCASTKAKDQ